MGGVPKTWRILLIPATIALAVGAGMSAAAGAWRTSAPSLALRVDPGNSVATMVRADQQLMASEDPAKLLRDTAPLARQALVRDPLNPRAIRWLGMAADLDGKRAEALRLLALSQRVSRRDLGTHLALIEYYTSVENIEAALDHYDLALTVSGPAGDMLFPILLGALSEPEIRQKLVPYVRGDRPWLRGLLSHAVTNPGKLENLVLLIRESGGLPRHADYREFETQLLTQLVIRNDFRVAREFFLSLPGASDALLRTTEFSPATTNPAFGPMAWYLSTQVEASGQVGEDGKLWVRAAPGERGTAAQRYLYLPPGAYVFHQVAEFMQDAGSALWELRCMRADGSAMIWQLPVPASREPKAASSAITVPADCPAQMLTLSAMGQDSQQEAEMTFSGISLRSANR